MRKPNYLLLIIIALFLAACDDGGYAPAYDPELQSIESKAQYEAAQLAIRRTDQAKREAETQATLSAARTQQVSEAEIALLNKQIEARWAEVYARQTEDARINATEEARKTEIAFIAQTTATYNAAATNWVPTAVSLQATQANIAARTDYAKARANLEVITIIIRDLFIIGALALIIYKLIDALTLRYYVVNTIAGPASITKDEYGIYRPQLMSANPNKPVTDVRFREIPDVISLNRSGTVLASPPMSEEERTRRNLINYLKTMDQNATQLARWSSIPGMTSEKWQRYVDILEQMGYVEVLPQRGTFVRGGVVGSIVYDLETNVEMPVLSPAD